MSVTYKEYTQYTVEYINNNYIFKMNALCVLKFENKQPLK